MSTVCLGNRAGGPQKKIESGEIQPISVLEINPEDPTESVNLFYSNPPRRAATQGKSHIHVGTHHRSRSILVV